MKQRSKKVTVKAWVMLDKAKPYARVCYGAAKGTKRHNQGYAAVFLRKPPKHLVPEAWARLKEIVPCVIEYPLPINN